MAIVFIINSNNTICLIINLHCAVSCALFAAQMARNSDNLI